MGKRAKGLDAIRQRNMLKKSMLSSCKKYAEQLEAENYALKHDPNTVIGQFIGQFRELYGQNQRLSTLAAVLIKRLDDKVLVSKEELESFNGKRINIKWELPEGVEKIEDAKEFTFTYELQEAPPEGQPVQVTETPGTHVHEDGTVHADADDAEMAAENELGEAVAQAGDEALASIDDEIPPAVEEPLSQ